MDAGKSATEAADEAAVCAAAGCVMSLAVSAVVVGTALGAELAGGNSGQRVATAAVALFQTGAFAEPTSVAALLAGLAMLLILAGGLAAGASSRTVACGSSAWASANDGFA